jgi:acyl-homoserine lactone acylase PvdQ
MRRLLPRAISVALPLVLTAGATAVSGSPRPAPTAFPADRTISRDVNPPGENGFVSIFDYGSDPNAYYDESKPNFGYPVPHFVDQLDDYWKIDPAKRIFPRYKSAHFYVHHKGDSKETLSNGAVIYRDARRGIPRIFAPTAGALFYAVGAAEAEDRMTQAEIFRRAALGRLAEILGPDYASYDYERRRDTYSPAEWDTAVTRLPPYLRNVLEDFSDGFNSVLLKDLASDHAPAELVALHDWPPNSAGENDPNTGVWMWNPVDSYAIASLMIQSFGDEGGNEVGHLALACWLQKRYGRSRGRAMFLDRLWTRDGLAPSSVPGNHRLPAQRFTMPKAQRRADGCGRNGDATRAARSIAARRALIDEVTQRLNLPRWGSNAIAVGPRKSRNHNAFLYGAPQVGYNLPSLFLEQEWHAKGWQVTGLGFAGLPAIPIGHGPDYAWTTTSGQTDMVDTYVVTLDPAGARSWFRGRWVPVDRRTEHITVGPPPPGGAGIPALREGPLPSDSTPKGCPPTCVITRVVHTSSLKDRYIGHKVLMPVYAYGPKVRCPDDSKRSGCRLAYAERKSWYGREPGTIVGFLNYERLDSLAARDHLSKLREFSRLTSHIVSSHNLLYADDRGHIGYWLGGSYPLRTRGTLTQLPLNGAGSEEWGRRGHVFLPFRKQPHSVDPHRGWVDSWNNKPSNRRGFMAFDTGDDTRWGLQHHVEAISDYMKASHRLGFNGVARAGFRAAFNDTRAKWVMPIVLRALADPRSRRACGARGHSRCPMASRFAEAARALRSWFRGDNPSLGGAERMWNRHIPKHWWDDSKRWPYNTGAQALWDSWWNVGMELAFHHWFEGAPADYPGPSGNSMENGEDSFLVHALLGPWRARRLGTRAPRVDYLSRTGGFPKSRARFRRQVRHWVAQSLNDTLEWLAHPSRPPAYVTAGVQLPDPSCCAANRIRDWREDQRAHDSHDMNCFDSFSVYDAPCMPAEDKGTFAQIVEVRHR